MRITPGRILLALGVMAALALGVWAMVPRPVLVETAKVIKGKFVATVDEDGKTRIRERYVVAAPLPGRLTRVRLKAGDAVKEDEELVILEAMKMENPIVAPGNGTVKEIKVKEGDKVNTSQVLVVLG